jgi:hypothetical protein
LARVNVRYVTVSICETLTAQRLRRPGICLIRTALSASFAPPLPPHATRRPTPSRRPPGSFAVTASRPGFACRCRCWACLPAAVTASHRALASPAVAAVGLARCLHGLTPQLGAGGSRVFFACYRPYGLAPVARPSALTSSRARPLLRSDAPDPYCSHRFSRSALFALMPRTPYCLIRLTARPAASVPYRLVRPTSIPGTGCPLNLVCS